MPNELPPNQEMPKEPTESAQPPIEEAQTPHEVTPSDQTPPNSVGKPPLTKQKKNALTFLVTVCALAVILLLLNLIPFDRLTGNKADETEEPVVTFSPDYFLTPDYEKDITEDDYYMNQLDRKLRFTTQTGETFAINGDAKEYGEICELFEAFRTAVTEGDCDAYNALFTDEYIEKKGAKQFTPQKLYNLSVTVLSNDYLDEGDANGLYKGATVSYCEVEYCILGNDGTLRADFYKEGESKAQIFEVLDYNGQVKISQVTTPKLNPVIEKEGISFMVFVWIAMIVLAVIAEAMSTALVAIWFLPAALISMILALLNVDVSIQVITYVVSALVLLILFKCILKVSGKKKHHTPTNADRIIGGRAIVTEEISNLVGSGEVKIDGKRWSARTEEESVTVAEGALVSVLRIEGVKLIVAPIEENAEK